MAFTQSELDALKKAYASGILEVRYGDKTVKYDSSEGLLMRIRVLEKEINGGGSILTKITATHSKGLD